MKRLQTGVAGLMCEQAAKWVYLELLKMNALKIVASTASERPNNYG